MGIPEAMRIVFFVVAVAAASAAGWHFYAATSSRTDYWCHCLGGFSAIAAAGTLVGAALKRYRGHWPFVLGTLMIAMSISAFGTAIDAHGPLEALGSGLFLICGVTLLFSGQKLHLCAIALEPQRPFPITGERRRAGPAPFGLGNRMRIALCIIGAAGLGLAGWSSIQIGTWKESSWCDALGTIFLAAAAAAVLIAGIKRYNGQWPFLIGAMFLVLGASAIGSAIDDGFPRDSTERANEVTLLALFSVGGILLLFSGHKLHHCVLELEARRGSGGTEVKPDAQQERQVGSALGAGARNPE